MNLELFQITDLTEGLDFEAKKALGRNGQGQLPENFFETYSAMANSEGGVVLLGVEEIRGKSWNVVGIPNPSKVIKELWDGLNNREKVSCNILSDADVRAFK